MKTNRPLEVFLGAAVLAAAVVFLAWAWQKTSLLGGQGFASFEAQFSSVGSLAKGSDIRVSGVKVGFIRDVNVDARTYRAVAELRIRDDLRLPEDSRLRIVDGGFLGGSFLDIRPGRSADFLSDGDRFTEVDSALSLEDLLGRAILLLTGQ